MKKWYVLTGMLVVFCCLAACGRAAEDKEAGSRTEENRMEEGREAESRTAEEEMAQGEDGGVYTFTDDLGREVSVSSCERTAALLGSYADMWILAGEMSVQRRKMPLMIWICPWRKIRST